MIEILAIIASPIIAFLVAHFVTDRKERVRRRHEVFVALWLTRGHLGSYGRLNPEHIRALNMIEIEFSPTWFDIAREEDLNEVIDAWRRYQANLNGTNTPDTWPERDEILTQLIVAMANVLGHKVGREEASHAYAPTYYQNNDTMVAAWRDAWLDIAQGVRAIHITADPPTPRKPEDSPQIDSAQPTPGPHVP